MEERDGNEISWEASVGIATFSLVCSEFFVGAYFSSNALSVRS